jgi:hypothetical protein
LSDSIRTIIGAIAAAGSVMSVFVYIHKRQKIPRLSFDGYFKTEQIFVTGNVRSKVTTYWVKVKDINPKSEGKIKSCVGSIAVGSEVYRTTWMFMNTSEHTFVKEAWLKLFDINSRDETVGFLDGKRSPASIGRRMGESVTIQLKAGRGHCPSPLGENIEYITKNARSMHSQ